MKSKNEVIIFPNYTGFLTAEKAAITFYDNREVITGDEIKPISLTNNLGSKYRKLIPWGEDNTLPSTIIDKVAESTDISANVKFNIEAAYGSGLMPYFWVYDSNGNKVYYDYMFKGEYLRQQIAKPENEVIKADLQKQLTAFLDTKEELQKFIDHNDLTGYLLEQITDLTHFYATFPEVIFNLEDYDKRKIVELNSKDASFCRWEEANSQGVVENMFYSALWWKYPNRAPAANKIVPVPVLDYRRPIKDILNRSEEEKRKNKSISSRINNYIVPIKWPSPGNPYYPRPYWYSILASGWYDFAIQIPQFKKYLLSNGMALKYHVEISKDYFPNIFDREGIKTDEDKQARIKSEYKSINEYLTGIKNTGKTMISYFGKDMQGNQQSEIKITVLKNEFNGGEYLEDMGDSSNMIAYSMGNHSALIGSAPGKNSGISGTDKRELFIIKQALLKPVRDRLLMPFYLIKAVNKWDPDLHFQIPNIELTTLDENKGSKEVIS